MKLGVFVAFIAALNLSPFVFGSPVSSSDSVSSFDDSTNDQQLRFRGHHRHDKDGKTINNRIIMIRHGEKTARKTGLSKVGKARAQCVRDLFGKRNKSNYNIGLIIAQSFNPVTRNRIRPYLTVKPLARDLHLPVHVGCDRTDGACVRRIVRSFARRSNKDVLVCWKHSELAHIARSLGAKRKQEYPDERYDLMWLVENERVVEEKSEKCAGIDDDWPDTIVYDPKENDPEEQEDHDWLDWSVPTLDQDEEEVDATLSTT